MKDEDTVMNKFCKRLGCPRLLEVLTTASWRGVQPILIKALRDRVKQKRTHTPLRVYESKEEFYGISSTNQRALHEFAGHFYSALPVKYEPVELSPISPLGLNAVLTRISQDISLSTIRASEVVSDPTTPLALECALRRKRLLSSKKTRDQTVHLATLHRVLRLQPFEKEKGYMQHFRLCGLCSGGRDTGGGVFFVDNILEHVVVWLEFVKQLSLSGYNLRKLEVKFSDIRILEDFIVRLNIPREVVNRHSLDDNFDLFREFNLDFPKEVESIHELSVSQLKQYNITPRRNYLFSVEERIIRPLREKYPQVRFCFDFSRKAGLGYYQHVCYHIFAENDNGKCVQLADGGSVGWLGKLLSSKKEFMITSGFGCELVQKLFSPTIEPY